MAQQFLNKVENHRHCKLFLYKTALICFYSLSGDTQVMAAVYGPVEVRMNKELLDKSLVEVIFRPKVGLPGITIIHEI